MERHEDSSGFSAETNVADTFEEIAASCMMQFRDHASKVHGHDEPEDVHQSRVAIRRLRAAFSLFKPAIADSQTQALRAELRRLADVLGEVRDLDIVLARTEDPALHARLSDMKTLAGVRLAGTLSDPHTEKILYRLEHFSLSGAWRRKNRTRGEEPTATFARKILGKRFKRLKKRGRRFTDMTDEERHRLRIEVKKLRYGAEFFGPLYGRPKKLRRFLKRAEKLQDRLGRLSDTQTAERILLPLGAAAEEIRSPKHERKDVERAGKALERFANLKPFWR